MAFYQRSCPIVHKTHLTSSIVSLVLRCPLIAESVKPGQFVMVRVREEIHPLLRRAYSVSRVFPESETFEIMVQKAGTGSAILLQKEEGEAVDILGPLGSRFTLPHDLKRAILVGGGIGIAPMFFVAQELEKRKVPYHILFGGRDHSQLFVLPEFEDRMRFATEDGSLGKQGLVTDLLQEFIQDFQPVPMVFACGPNRMLAAVAGVAQAVAFPCQVSMEAPMACGVGVCMGCPVPTTAGGYAYVCKEGPVFPAEKIDFNQLLEL